MVIKKIKKEPLGVLLFSAKDESPLLNVLEERTEYNEQQNLCGQKHKRPLSCYVIPVRYNVNREAEKGYRLNCRDFAIQMMYERWCKANDRPIKSPYDSKQFQNYLSQIELLRSDFVLIKA